MNEIKEIFDKTIENCELLIIKVARGERYDTKKIHFASKNEVNEIINDIKLQLQNNGVFEMDIVEYNGIINSNEISKVSLDSNIYSNVNKFILEVSTNDNTDADFTVFKNGYCLKGQIDSNNIYIVSLKPTIREIKKAFDLVSKNKFKKCNSKFLKLSSSIDLIVFDDTAYFLSTNIEKYLKLDRTFKTICANSLKKIEMNNIISNFENFAKFAQVGQNPRLFYNFNEESIKIFNENKEKWHKLCEEFRINIDKDGRILINSSEKSQVNRVIKFLCGKPKIDPFSEETEEATSVRKWV